MKNMYAPCPECGSRHVTGQKNRTIGWHLFCMDCNAGPGQGDYRSRDAITRWSEYSRKRLKEKAAEALKQTP